MLIKFLDGTEKEFETLRRADLIAADLSCTDLSGANLSRAIDLEACYRATQ